MVYMGAMYIDCVYGCYIHVCWLCILHPYTQSIYIYIGP